MNLKSKNSISLKIAYLFLSSVFTFLTFAAPPQDLTIFDSGKSSENEGRPSRRSRPSRIKEAQITAGETPLASLKNAENPVVPRMIKFDVVCRESPGRKGKAKVKLSNKSKVLEQKRSANWALIAFTPKQPPCWVPVNALN
jgi:hypothetical protein